jgi:hypothetical protein
MSPCSKICWGSTVRSTRSYLSNILARSPRRERSRTGFLGARRPSPLRRSMPPRGSRDRSTPARSLGFSPQPRPRLRSGLIFIGQPLAREPRSCAIHSSRRAVLMIFALRSASTWRRAPHCQQALRAHEADVAARALDPEHHLTCSRSFRRGRKSPRFTPPGAGVLRTHGVGKNQPPPRHHPSTPMAWV